MKTLKAIIFASAALLAAVACTKEANPKEESVPSAPGTIEVNVTALIGDLTPSEGTKATMDPVIRLTWQNNDNVYAYDATQKIGELTVTPASDGLSAKLSGNISTPAEGTTRITLVYCTGTTPTMTGNKLSFDLSNQSVSANPFVVYATLDYNAGQTSITDKIVPFKFATSLMRVTVTGLANTSITEATVSGVNTKCELTVNSSDVPTVAGITSGSISRTTGFTKSDGRAVFNVSVAKEAENTNRKLTIKQGDLKYGSKLMSQAIAEGQSIISVYALTEQTGSRGTIGVSPNNHDYVYVAGKKWATQNIAITDSGKGAWLSVKVPGNSSENVVVGDYFQWGAYPGYCGSATAADKGLLIYESFTNDGSSGSFTKWKKTGSTDYQFSTSSISPYYSSSYTRYNSSDKTYRPNLDISDDVARTLWGDTWRMPTSAEFKALYDATKWTWKDNGYYVTKLGEDLEDDKSNALLFFPAAGRGGDGDLRGAGSTGRYWSSTLYSDDTGTAYYLNFISGFVYPQYCYYRYYGFSVRPLSD